MFKKKEDLSERSKTLIKNKEVRKVKSDMATLFSGTTVDGLFPGKGNVSVKKLASKTLLYAVEDKSIAFDIKARGNLVPTLHTLWTIAGAEGNRGCGLREVLIHPQVSTFIMNGADLMLPGVATLSCLEGITEGEVVAIRVLGNPLPFAVGEAEVGWSHIQQCGKKGKGVAVLHLYGDMLWRANGRVAPNAGFTPEAKMILPIEEEVLLTAIDAEVKAQAKQDENENEDEDEDEDEDEGSRSDGDGSGGHGGDEDDEDDDGPSLPPKEVDERLLVHLLRTIKYVLRDTNLPILANVFWSMVMRSVLAAGEKAVVHVKGSTFKKVGTFLTHAERLGLLTVKNTNDGVASLTHVSRLNEIFREYKDDIKVDDPPTFRSFCDGSGDSAGSGSGCGSGGKGSHSGGTQGAMRVVQLYKFPKNIVTLFGNNVVGTHDGLLTGAEVRGFLFKYAEERGLASKTHKGSLELPRSDPLSKFIGPKQLSMALSGGSNKATSGKREKGEKTTATQDEEKAQHEAEVAAIEQNYARIPDDMCSLELDDLTVDDGASGGRDSIVAGVWMGTGLSSQQGVRSGPKTQSAKATPRKTTVQPSSSLSVWKRVPRPQAQAVTAPVAAPVAVKQVLKAPAPVTPEEPSANTDRKGVSFASSAGAGVPGTASVEPTIDTLTYAAFVEAVKAKMASYSAVIRDGEAPLIQSGTQPRVNIDVARRMGNKVNPPPPTRTFTTKSSSQHIDLANTLICHVTHAMTPKVVSILSGLEPYGVEPREVARAFQRQFACSASISAAAGRSNVKEVMVQGNWAAELEGHLVSVIGVPKSLITVKMGKGVKAKKR